MRRFNFNSFKKDQENTIPNSTPTKKRTFSAYRTIISRHEAAKERLKDEPIAAIQSE